MCIRDRLYSAAWAACRRASGYAGLAVLCGRCAAGWVRLSAGAVSYTHLDVYKRQVLNVAVNYGGRQEIVRGMQILARRVQPVSYTHLDVYKRQRLCGYTVSAQTFFANAFAAAGKCDIL